VSNKTAKWQNAFSALQYDSTGEGAAVTVEKKVLNQDK
jgi:hypothetical protein